MIFEEWNLGKGHISGSIKVLVQIHTPAKFKNLGFFSCKAILQTQAKIF